MVAAILAPLQTATPTPGVGPGELVDIYPDLVRMAWFAVGTLVALAIGMFGIEPAISRIVRRRNRNNPTLQDAIRRYVRLVIVILAVFVGAGVAGYGRFLSNSALVIAAVTIAVGVAGQAVIGSIVSGIVLVLDPEFKIGNYIESPAGNGTVKEITLRVTRIQTQNGELVTIPNTMLTSQPITRPYGRERYRVVERIGLDFEADFGEAIEELEAAASAVDGVLDDPAPVAYVDEFGSDAVFFRVHFWIRNPGERLFAVRSAFAEAVNGRLDEAGIGISPASKRDLRGRIEIDDSR